MTAHTHVVDLAGVCSGPGPCDVTPLGSGNNWLKKVNGLPLYVRAIAHSLRRGGMDESRAISTAIATVKRWAAGGGNVTAATRARAAKAVAEWEAKKSASHALTADLITTVDLAAIEREIEKLTVDLAADVFSTNDGPNLTVPAGGPHRYHHGWVLINAAKPTAVERAARAVATDGHALLHGMGMVPTAQRVIERVKAAGHKVTVSRVDVGGRPHLHIAKVRGGASLTADETATVDLAFDAGEVRGPDGRWIKVGSVRKKSEELAAAANAKRAEADRIATGAGSGDRAAGRLSAPGLAQFGRRTDAALRAHSAATAAAQDLEHRAALAGAREKEAARTRLTHEDLKGATYVRDRFGWHQVVRVNAKSVTVKTPYSWTDTIPHEKIHEVRKAANLTAEPTATVDLAWNEAAHPRAPKGTAGGGRFAGKNANSAPPSAMAANVRDFQRRNKLPVTGIVDTATAAKIHAAMTSSGAGGGRGRKAKAAKAARATARAQKQTIATHVATVNAMTPTQRAAARAQMPTPPTGYVWTPTNTLRRFHA